MTAEVATGTTPRPPRICGPLRFSWTVRFRRKRIWRRHQLDSPAPGRAHASRPRQTGDQVDGGRLGPAPGTPQPGHDPVHRPVAPVQQQLNWDCHDAAGARLTARLGSALRPVAQAVVDAEVRRVHRARVGLPPTGNKKGTGFVANQRQAPQRLKANHRFPFPGQGGSGRTPTRWDASSAIALTRSIAGRTAS